jgi:hypothetical protein
MVGKPMPFLIKKTKSRVLLTHGKKNIQKGFFKI